MTAALGSGLGGMPALSVTTAPPRRHMQQSWRYTVERIWKRGVPVRSESGGRHRSGIKRRKMLFFFGRASPFVGSKAQLVVLVSAFVLVSTV